METTARALSSRGLPQGNRSLSELWDDEVIDMKTSLRVNNTTHELSVNSRVTLLDALRDAFCLTGTT